MNISYRTFFVIISLLVLGAIASTAYLFYYQKSYDFVVEAPCDPTVHTCFYRDCEFEECPPNGYDSYRILTMSASDFDTCADETCLAECSSGVIECSEIVCGESEEDVCSTGSDSLLR